MKFYKKRGGKYMDRDEEKDLYIKAKLKDGHIPEKIDNLFNNSAKLVENIEHKEKQKAIHFQENSNSCGLCCNGIRWRKHICNNTRL